MENICAERILEDPWRKSNAAAMSIRLKGPLYKTCLTQRMRLLSRLNQGADVSAYLEAWDLACCETKDKTVTAEALILNFQTDGPFIPR